MDKLREITRLNLALELSTECVALVSTEAVVRVVSEKLRWLFDFDVCVLALRVSDTVRWLSMRPGDESLFAIDEGQQGSSRALVEQVLMSGAPASLGRPMLAMAHPLGSLLRPSGALSIESSSGYSHRDLRFFHHVCSALGAAINRIEQSAGLATAHALAAARDQAARDKERAASKAKDTFLAMLGHELRNPLAPIISAAELLRRDTSGRALENVEIVTRQAQHLDRLVSDLLDVSRVTTGKVDLRRSAVDLRDIASRSAEMARPRLLAKGQRLTIDLPTFPVMVDGDEARLIQVGCNLLNNASGYSPSGSPIELRVWVGIGEALLEVRDQGIGIALAMLGSIFEMFVQGGRSKEVAPGGLGLGLAVSRALVELHGGSVSASSGGEGLGSDFRVALPLLSPSLSQAEAGTCEAEQPAAPGVARIPQRILVVDDNADAAYLLGELLRASGHEVCVAYSPAEAIAAASTFAPDVAVLDIGLPVMDGYQLAHELRQRLGASAPTMIALSGFGQPGDRQRSAQRGFAAHLVKPPSFDELLASIQAAVPITAAPTS